MIRFVALFNTEESAAVVTVSFAQIGVAGKSCAAREVWSGRQLGELRGTVATEVPMHGVALVELSDCR